MPRPISMERMRSAATAVAFAISSTLLPISPASADPNFAQMRGPKWPMPSNSQLQTEEIRGPLSPVIGPGTAPVSIVAFSDYYCPYCRTLSATLAQLVDRYPEQVRIVYRHFATTPESQELAQAALCASEQNRFREYHNLIFTTRGVSPQSIPQLATHLELDLPAFNDCVSTRRYEQRVRDDIEEGERLGIEVTPTLFVNGKRIAGAASLETLSARVEKALPR